MICGYSGKLLEIDLTNSNIKEFRLNDALLKEYIGGRGLAVKILWDRLGRKWEKINPLKAENILLFLTGPLTGFFPGGRICVSGKSPQSNGIVGSTVAGEFGVELKCAGYDGILITGQAETPVYLFIKDSDVELRKASEKELEQIMEIGPKMAESIHLFFSQKENMRLISDLEKAGVQTEEKSRKKIMERDRPLDGKTFVLTGSLEDYTREKASELIESFGGRTSSSVSKKTDYLLAGKDPGSKLDKAKKLGVKIISERDFTKLIAKNSRQ